MPLARQITEPARRVRHFRHAEYDHKGSLSEDGEALQDCWSSLEAAIRSAQATVLQDTRRATRYRFPGRRTVAISAAPS
jgi:hypothetical protein